MKKDSVPEEFDGRKYHIARIPADDKTPEEEYERRLSICKECEKLLSGMCRMCGCYVEMRAAIALRDCPGKKW